MNYKTCKPTHLLDVLGTTYAIYLDVPIDQDDFLKTCNAYCDKTAKRIVVCAEPEECELADWPVSAKISLRHEIVHAFMYESGIDGNTTWDVPGEEHPEKAVAWIAIQFPKMLEAFEKVGAL